MKPNLDRALASLVLLLGAATVGGSLHAFEINLVCGFNSSQETRLPVNASGVPTNYTWTLVTGLDPASGYGPAAAPGFPSSACVPTAVTQSAAQAALAWSTATLATGQPAVNLNLPGAPVAISASAVPGQNNVSILTLWAPPTTWTPLGGAFAISSSAVWANPTCPGTITPLPCLLPTVISECDIALNTLSVSASGVPAWSFVEDVAGQTFSSWPNSAIARQDPTLGYVDLQGVLTHEMGHLLGLGHSLVDAPTIGGLSLLPTMFERFPTEQYGARTLTAPSGACAPGSWPTFQTGAQETLYAKETRTLQQDDISSVHGYGMQTLATSGTGTIRGVVYMGFSSPPLAPAVGMSVVVSSVTNPNGVRAGTFTRLAGFGSPDYAISGLPPGDYFVSVEPVGDVALGFPAGPELLSDVPQYMLNNGCTTLTPPWRDATAELLDSAESVTEYAPAGATARVSQRATRVSVVADQTTQLPFIGVETIPTPNAKNRLRVGYGNGPTSARGVVVPSLAALGAASQLYFQVPELDGVAGEFAVVGIALDRTMLENLLGDGQLLQIAPAATYVAAPILGTATVAVPIQPNFVHTNLYAQAAIFRANGSIEFTNVVSAFVVDR